MWKFEFQLYSFIAQYYTLLGNEKNDNLMYEEADKYYSKSCHFAEILFGGGENDSVSSERDLILIQEKHRRMRINLILKRNDVAEKIYEGVKKVLINSISIHRRMVEPAFINYAELWKEFGFSDYAREAYEFALKCNIEGHEEILQAKLQELI